MSFRSLNFLFLKFFVFNLIILSLTRVILIYFFSNNLDELLNTLIFGLRFDLKLIGTLAIPLIYLPYLILQKYYNYKFLDRLLLLFTLIILFLSFVNYGYYHYFNSEFTPILFGIVNDGTKEVILSIFSNKNLLVLIGLFFITAYGVYKLWNKFNLDIEEKNYKKKIYSL